LKEKLKKLYHWSNTWTGTIVIVLLVMFFLAQAFVIPSGSMQNTLLKGDALFAKKFAYGVPIPRIPWLEIPIMPDFNDNGHLIEGEKPKRGDIVIFRYPVNEKVHFVKRCVATGGDKLMVKEKILYIQIESDNKKTVNYAKENSLKTVTINGETWIKNPYRNIHKGIHNDDEVEMAELVNYGPIIVNEKEYFMMGDNRDHSHDSRFWGSVKYKYIVGKPWFVYMSWDDDFKIRWNRVGKNVSTLEEELRNGIKNY
jgi:signal peptidase I